MNRKKIFIIGGIVTLLVLAASIFYVQRKKQTVDHTTSQNINSDLDENPNASRPAYYFTGDKAYLIKGKLIDKTAKEVYDKLPDTLLTLKFGDVLYCTTCEEEEAGLDATTRSDDPIEVAQKQIDQAAQQATTAAQQDATLKVAGSMFFSPFFKKIKSFDLNAIDMNSYDPKLIAYIKLADEGKIEYPVFTTNESSSMMDQDSYEAKYQGQFEDDEVIQKIPFLMKDKIIDFLNSDDGKDYTLLRKDKREYSNLVVQASLTGNSKQDVAVILQPKNEYNSGHNEKLLILSYKNWNEVYILYNESNYDKVLLEPIRKDTTDESCFYKNSEERTGHSSHDCLRIKIQGQPDAVLEYDNEFDKMKSYIQKPKSELDDANNGNAE